MTVDAYVAAPVYTVAGTGPYAVPFDYDAGEVVVRVTVDGVAETTLIDNIDYTLAPSAPATGGAVTLTAGAATAHAGSQLRITRNTAVEQGWAAQGGAREAGLEEQLDLIVRALQDAGRRDADRRAEFLRTLRDGAIGAVVAALPSVAARAQRLLGFDVAGDPIAHEGVFSISVASGWLIGTALTAGLQTPSADTQVIRTEGYAVRGDLGGATYVSVGAEPAHAGKVQTADGRWWELREPSVNFEMFGAGAGATDATAIQAACDYSRLVGAPVFALGRTYDAGDATIYYGGASIVGAGAPLNVTWPGAKTIIGGRGNPVMESNLAGSTSAFFGASFLARLCIRGAGSAGPASTIRLWDDATYAGQVGLWLGFPHLGVAAGIDGEGGSFNVVSDVTIQDCSGIGCYVFRSFGRSVIERLFVRACGGDRALAASDNKAGVALKITASVDLRIRDVHIFNSPHVNPDANGRGTSLMVDDARGDVDTDVFTWEASANLYFDGLHTEGYPELRIRNGKDLHFGTVNFNPASGVGARKIIFGDASSPSGNGRVRIEQLRFNGVEDCDIAETMEFRCGLVTVGSPEILTTRFRYWGRVYARIDSTAVRPHPQEVRGDQPGGAPAFPRVVGPLLLDSYVYTADLEENVLPPPSLHAGGSPYSGGPVVTCTYGSASGAPVFGPASVRLPAGNVTAQEVEIDVIHAERLDGYNQVLSGGSPVAGGKLGLFRNGTSVPVTTYTSAGMATANAHPVVADGSGNLPEIYAGSELYRVVTYNAADEVIATVDNVLVGAPLTAGFWIDAGAHVVGELTYGIKDAAGATTLALTLGGDEFPVGGRAVFRAFNFYAPPVASGGDSRWTFWVRSTSASLKVIHPFVLRGLLTAQRFRGLPAAWPSPFGPISLANPSVTLRGEAAWNPGSVADGARVTNVFSLPGVKIGDHANVAPGADVTGCDLTWAVTDDDEITATLTNRSGGTIVFANSTWRLEARTT